MVLDFVSRRKFAMRFASLFSATAAATVLGSTANAKKQPNNEGVRKLNDDGKPADGTQFITPIVAHNGLIYVAGQGAHDEGPSSSWDIGKHTTIVLDKVKK